MSDLDSNENELIKAVVDAAVPRHVELGKQIAVLAMLREETKENLQRFLEMDTSLKISSEDIETSESFDLEVSASNNGSAPSRFELVVEAPGFSPAEKVKPIVLNDRLDSIPSLVFLSATTIGRTEVRVKLLRSKKVVAYCSFVCECSARSSASSSHQTFKPDYWKAG